MKTPAWFLQRKDLALVGIAAADLHVVRAADINATATGIAGRAERHAEP